MLSDLFKQNQRGTASAIYYLGIPLGVGFGMLIAAFFGPIFGWRAVFIFLGLIGMGLVILTYFLFEPIRGQLDINFDKTSKPNSIKDIALKNAPIYHHMATRLPQDSESGNQNLPYDNAPPSLAKRTHSSCEIKFPLVSYNEEK